VIVLTVYLFICNDLYYFECVYTESLVRAAFPVLIMETAITSFISNAVSVMQNGHVSGDTLQHGLFGAPTVHRKFHSSRGNHLPLTTWRRS
jgi:hypothetical protein